MNIKGWTRQAIKNNLNKLLSRFDLVVGHRTTDPANYISLRKTIAAAAIAGMSVGDYIDTRFNVPGTTSLTMQRMADFGVFGKSIKTVVEIGPGSGRYLEKTIERCQPSSYEIYETAEDWRQRLVDLYSVKAHLPDGRTLSNTPDNSADLVQAHKVFSSLQVSIVCQYIDEMARVASVGGWLVFDLLTESCLSRTELKKWYSSGASYANSMLPRDFLVGRMKELNVSLVGEFMMPMLPGITHYFVFRKGSPRAIHAVQQGKQRHGGKRTSFARS